MRQYRGGKGLANITNQDVLLSSYADYSSPGMILPDPLQVEKMSQETSLMSEDLFDTPVSKVNSPNFYI